MFFERVRALGITLIVAAVSVSAWKTLGAIPLLASREDGAKTVAVTQPAVRAEWTIPVEIVEAGEEPRLHEVRVNR